MRPTDTGCIHVLYSKHEQALSREEQALPEGAFIVAGGFNQVSLKSVVPKFVQHAQCPPGGKKIPDQVYSNLKQVVCLTLTLTPPPSWLCLTTSHCS